MSLFKKEDWSFPIEFDKSCHFHEDYLIMDGKKYRYNELFSIIYTDDSRYVNGVRISHKINMILAFTNKDYIPFPIEDEDFTGIAKFDFDRGLVPTNTRLGKVLEFIFKYLQSKTFEQRLQRQLKSLDIYGKFSFFDDLPVFFNNGDLFINGKFVGNLKEKYDNGKIIDGERYGGYKDKHSNPYVYGFEKGTKFFGLISEKVEFANNINRDVMNRLFNNLYRTGKMNG